jgi:anti-sigma regulatory factor (Ser/Thr protein kinase)
MTVPASENLTQSYPAVPESVPLARQALTRFAESIGAAADEVDDIRLAVSEALTNAVIHAYRGDRGSVHVSAALASSELWVLIADEGRGLQTGGGTGGLGVGLAVISEVSDGFAIVNRSGGGTEVRLRFALTSLPADQFDSSSASAAAPASPTFSTTT